MFRQRKMEEEEKDKGDYLVFERIFHDGNFSSWEKIAKTDYDEAIDLIQRVTNSDYE